MKLTNRLGLPDAIVQALKNDPYDKGNADISVTSLIDSPRKVALAAQYADSLTEDASDRIWSLLGQSIHTILERANRKGVSERRLSIVVEGWKISGGMDLYDEAGVLSDYKTTSVWAVKNGLKPEWEKQLNVYAHILRANGHEVKGLQIVALLRDWSAPEASRAEYYPQAQVVTMDVPLWSDARAAKYVRERVILHQQARLSLPACTDEEMWTKPTVFAVMERGKKRAVKLHASEADAQAHAARDKSFYVEKRPGERTRCRTYCQVSKFCAQWLNELNEKGEAK